MAYIEWSDDLSVNVREIDRQHKTLVEKINMLHQAMLENRGREAQQKIIFKAFQRERGTLRQRSRGGASG